MISESRSTKKSQISLGKRVLRSQKPTRRVVSICPQDMGAPPMRPANSLLSITTISHLHPINLFVANGSQDHKNSYTKNRSYKNQLVMRRLLGSAAPGTDLAAKNLGVSEGTGQARKNAPRLASARHQDRTRTPRRRS